MSRFLREDPLFAGILFALCMASLFVVWLPEYLPLLDHPQHVWLLDAISDYGDPGKRYSEYFSLGFQASTYDLYYWPGALLAMLFGAEAASRLLLSVYVLALPFGMVALLEQLGRNRRLAVLSAPLILNTSFVMGFEAFCLSLAAFPWVLALADRCFAERTRRREIALAVSLNALFLLHALTFLLTVAVVALWAVQRGGGLRGLSRRWLPVVAGTPLFVVWFARRFAARPDWHFGAGGKTDWLPLGQRLSGIPDAILGGFNGQLDSWAFLALAATIGACLLLAQSEPGSKPTADRPFLVERRCEAAAFAAFLAYLAVPYEIPGIWYVGPRLLVPAVLLLIACLRFDPVGWRIAALVPVLTAAVVWPAQAYARFDEVSSQVGDLDEAAAVVRPGSRILGLVLAGDDGEMTWNPFLHAAAYVTVARGGAAGFSFAGNPAVPVQYRLPADFPHPSEWQPWQFDPERHGRRYDYLLVRGKPGLHPNVFARRWLDVAVDYYGERWSVYHMTERPRTLVYDLLERLPDARVELVRGGATMPCVVTEPGRFQCGPQDWEFVGRHVSSPLQSPLPCLWLHPYAGAVLRVTYPEVTLGDAFYGLFGLVETAQATVGPRLRVRIEGGPDGDFGHEGKGIFSIVYLDTRSRAGQTAAVTLEVSAASVGSQHACFLGGTVRP